MKKELLEILICPVAKCELQMNNTGTELISKLAKLAYPIRQGVPVLLEHEARELSEQELNESETKLNKPR